MQVRDNEAPEDYFYVSGLCFSMTPFFLFLELRGAQMAWDWSGADTPMPGLRDPAGISAIIRQSVLMSQDTWQRDTRDSCDNVNSNISWLFCCKVSPMCQYWEIVSEEIDINKWQSTFSFQLTPRLSTF